MQTIQKKIEVNYRPLQTSGGIEVVGSVPDVQVYQADKAEYTPDYTLTPPDAVPPGAMPPTRMRWSRWVRSTRHWST
mgnify:CR=1 FL=1